MSFQTRVFSAGEEPAVLFPSIHCRRFSSELATQIRHKPPKLVIPTEAAGFFLLFAPRSGRLAQRRDLSSISREASRLSAKLQSDSDPRSSSLQISPQQFHSKSARFCIGYFHAEVPAWLARQLIYRNRASAALCAATPGGSSFTGNYSARRIWPLRHPARFRRRLLRLGSVSFAFLFSADRSAASLVAVFSRTPGARRPARISHHLLLLPQSLLPRIFSRSSGLRRRRTRQAKISRRNRFPFILQNVHRYFFYLAIIFLGFLWHDAIKGFLLRWPVRHRRRQPHPPL